MISFFIVYEFTKSFYDLLKKFQFFFFEVKYVETMLFTVPWVTSVKKDSSNGSRNVFFSKIIK